MCGSKVQQADRVAGGEDPGLKGRVASVDALRGLTILLMIFVNDLGPHAPSWMHHIQPPNADGMTLADVVFPAFLFIVGVSIPLAIDRGPLPWTRRFAQLGHIATALSRSCSWVWCSSMPTATKVSCGAPVGIAGVHGLDFCLVRRPARARDETHDPRSLLKIAGALGLIVLLAIVPIEATTDQDCLLWGMSRTGSGSGRNGGEFSD